MINTKCSSMRLVSSGGQLPQTVSVSERERIRHDLPYPCIRPAPSNQFAAQVSHCIPEGIQQLHLLRIIAPLRCSPKAMKCTNADVAGPGVDRDMPRKRRNQAGNHQMKYIHMVFGVPK